MDRTEVRGYIEISRTNGVEVKNFEGGSGTNCIVAEAVDSGHQQTIRFSELYRFVGDPSTCIPWFTTKMNINMRHLDHRHSCLPERRASVGDLC